MVRSDARPGVGGTARGAAAIRVIVVVVSLVLTALSLAAVHTGLGALAELVSSSIDGLATDSSGASAAPADGSVITVGVLTFLALVVTTRVCTVVATRSGVSALPWLVLGGLLGYLVLPAAWDGSALLGRQLVGAGPVAWLIDLLLWSVAVAIGVLWGDVDPDPAARPGGPQGLAG